MVKHRLSIKELIDWVADPGRWKDITVDVDETSGSRPMAVTIDSATDTPL